MRKKLKLRRMQRKFPLEEQRFEAHMARFQEEWGKPR